jgi:hypothetical protein
MKKMFYTFILMLLGFYGYNQCNPIDSNLLLKLNFSNNDLDSSVYRHPMLSIGGPVLTNDRNGNANSAMDFDGDDAHLVVADSNTNYKCNFPITISVWINPDTINLTNPIFTNEDYQGAYSGVWLQLTTDGYLALSYGDGTGNSGGSRMSAIGNSVIPSHQWTHVVATVRAASDFSLYVNGVSETFNLNGSGGNMVYLNNDTMPSRLGTFFKGNSTPRFFDGAIDDLRFWNADLLPKQVEVLYANTPVYVPYFNLDTLVVCNNETDTLKSFAGYCEHLWNTGDTTPNVLVDGNALGVGNHPFVLFYTESFGYTYFDTVVVRVENCISGIAETSVSPFVVSPNPFTDKISIDFALQGLGSDAVVEIYNALGSLVKRERISYTKQVLEITECSSGFYLLRVLSNGQSFEKKLIKE